MIIASVYSSCGKTTFGAKNGTNHSEKDNAHTANGDASGGETVQESFNVNSENLKISVIDVVILFDTSGSMDEEKKKLEAELPAFLAQLKSQLAEDDFQVYLIGDMDYEPKKGEKIYKLHPQENKSMEVDSHDALKVLSSFLDYEKTTSFTHPKLRSNANLEIIIFSDDNAELSDILEDQEIELANESVSGFFSHVIASHSYENRARVHAAVGLKKGAPDNASNDWCTIVAVGEEYISLAKSTQGLVQDLCSEDWGAVMKSFGTEIIEQAGNMKYKLKSPVNLDVIDLFSVSINETNIDKECYSFGEDSQTISILRKCVKAGSKANIIVTYVPKQ